MDTPPVLVGRVGAVLRAVAGDEPAGASTSAVARSARLPRATGHRLLVALQAEGLIDRDPTSGSWLLGPELFFLGVAATPRYDVTAVAAPFVRRLARAPAEGAFFSARRGEETICLLREDGSFPIRSHLLHEGIRLPLGVASAGMVILAHLTDREIDEYLTRTDLVGEHGAQHAAEEVRHHVALTRQTGYAINPTLLVEGSWGIAAAVFDAAEQPRWALSLTGVEHRFAAHRRPDLGGCCCGRHTSCPGRYACIPTGRSPAENGPDLSHRETGLSGTTTRIHGSGRPLIKPSR